LKNFVLLLFVTASLSLLFNSRHSERRYTTAPSAQISMITDGVCMY
jgi:hypothetical protein